MKMAQEPRDNAWAADTESLIQDEVVSRKPGTYSIRNIECRSSICAAEVASLSNGYVGETYDFLHTNDLVDAYSYLGSLETDDLGRPVSVTVVFFFKWSSFDHSYWYPPSAPASN
jgi:hypothetical protein